MSTHSHHTQPLGQMFAPMRGCQQGRGGRIGLCSHSTHCKPRQPKPLQRSQGPMHSFGLWSAHRLYSAQVQLSLAQQALQFLARALAGKPAHGASQTNLAHSSTLCRPHAFSPSPCSTMPRTVKPCQVQQQLRICRAAALAACPKQRLGSAKCSGHLCSLTIAAPTACAEQSQATAQLHGSCAESAHITVLAAAGALHDVRSVARPTQQPALPLQDSAPPRPHNLRAKPEKQPAQDLYTGPAQAVVPEDQLQVSLLHRQAAILRGGQAGYALGGHLLDDLERQLWVDSARERPCELGQPCPNILLRCSTRTSEALHLC